MPGTPGKFEGIGALATTGSHKTGLSYLPMPQALLVRPPETHTHHLCCRRPVTVRSEGTPCFAALLSDPARSLSLDPVGSVSLKSVAVYRSSAHWDHYDLRHAPTQ